VKLSKEEIETKLSKLTAKLPKLEKGAKELPIKEEVEVDDSKKIINPRLIANKSQRKTKKKIQHLKKLLKAS
jgi:hypothetical protein